jgi:hypothetical protein
VPAQPPLRPAAGPERAFQGLVSRLTDVFAAMGAGLICNTMFATRTLRALADNARMVRTERKKPSCPSLVQARRA